VTEYPDDAVAAAENAETARFAFLVRNKISYDSRKTLEIDSIIVQSPLLKEALGTVLEDYPGITTNLQRLVFKAPFQPFVHRWTKLVDILETTTDETMRAHLKLFHKVLYEELKDAIAAKNDLVANGVITFEHLWTIFEPGVLVYGTEEGKERVFELQSASYQEDRSGVAYLQLHCRGIDWDGDKFGSSWLYLSNFEFEGTKSITRLAYFPLGFHPHEQDLISRLTIRGKVFQKFAGYHFMAYRGTALTYGRCGLVKQTVDSRIIIDCEAHNRFLPNKAVSLTALGKAQGQYVGTDEDSDMVDSDDDSAEYVSTPDEDGSTGSRPKQRPLTSKELLLAVPYVRGYALKKKKWFVLFVDQIIPIKFSDNAFQSLVMPNEKKDLILAFVESQVKHKDEFDDIIEGKGRGLIMLLSGPPGVGKTLTAESVAENMRVPLYMMSAGDLGLDPAGIEESLNTILEMVAKWNAVLLLDEADVFLEARSTSDLERNKLVSIFLRVLEYYEGILFLTTNRVSNIDDAFHSRIHISMQYPSLTAASRRHIWTTFMSKTSGLSNGQLDALAQVELNGRQIKNVLKTAQMLARRANGDGKVNMGHIETILAIERGKDFARA
jgi:ATPase family associated with various cellular activities (AAA)